MRKRKLLVIPIVLFCLQNNWAASNIDSSDQSFIPKNWEITEKVQGDLNADGQADLALIITENNPKNIVKNTGLGGSELDLNPRKLLILFKNNQSYHLISSNTTLPSAGSAESPCLSDPLGDGDTLEIKKGVLKIALHYWLSCGSWYVTNHIYTFRYQDQKFKLIGYDNNSFHRATGDISAQSINFLTAKIKNTSGMNEFVDMKEPIKITWDTLKTKKNYQLDSFNFTEIEAFK